MWFRKVAFRFHEAEPVLELNGPWSDLAEAEMIAEKLGYLPLALNQAGGYIAAMQISLSQYLQLYTTNFRRVASTGHLGMGTYRNDTIFTTWQISFNALPLPASELLLLCAFLGSQEIVEELIQRGWGGVSWLGKGIFFSNSIKYSVRFN